MKSFFVAAILLLVAGCATVPSRSEPSDPAQQLNEAWVRNREMYYRSNGWNSLDASSQAMQDLEAGKTPPADRPRVR